MIAIGYTSSGKRKEFKCYHGKVSCSGEDLVSLIIPEGAKDIFCNNNKLKELILPEGVNFLFCRNNLLSELNIPKGIKYLYCDRNVKGLYSIDWNCDIRLF